MNISEIASVMGVGKSFLYTLVKTHPSQVPTSREDLESWSEFIYRHRVQPTSNDGPPRRRSVSALCKERG